ncbi:DEHA2B09570p [Debaryomyces hansenii CBS767]|uniref:DEHA2B09570p n=1 Tax=Debaryomyces hansenii (strain ATCC 36239 / CBS 767 / BCRC 21394 / JCM 1990 / NBRC 0083 / IGC 2968) TaxID=284592 RepID=Q6BWQ2_DEBHA|nr:DEHA2B09570p [Debaryomyces hansenii CBS767]CAG85371.1 DEHA2B09570p [Debaryomyces hansenii CBS767]|eukprot:XP_457367.1 DEHA2B09570p [Debaryomyces hansenii CBS767]
MSNPYGNNSYEMGNYNKYSSGSGTGSNEDDFVTYMNEINDINNSLDQYSNLVNLVSNKQRNFVQELDLNEEDADYNSKQIDALVSESQSLQNDLKNRIKNVQTQAAQSKDQHKMDQAESCRKRFLEIIQEYRVVESNNREQTKVQAERQYRIIKPDASDDEVRAAVEDGNSQQYFQQALMQSNRRGEARTVLNEVQVRHRELLKLEKTMAELTQLFHDMEEMIIEQDQPIQQIDEQIHTAQHDIEQGVGHTNKAVTSAKKARKKKIWCLVICLIIIAILAIVLGSVFGTK